jgi:mono/diheme cytochrome c family protein
VPHLSELHGAATHLAVVAIPVYALLVLLRRLGRAEAVTTPLEPWVLGAVVLGVAASGATGLLVWGQAQQQLRGHGFRNGTVHFWLGIALGVLVLGVAALRFKPLRSGRTLVGTGVVAVAVLAFAMVSLQGYLGGRMTYEHGVGIEAGGQFAQTATGVRDLELSLAKGATPVQAGGEAFSADGLGCASCHGNLAQGGRGPELAGGRSLEKFRGVHGHGLFPPNVVTDRDFAAIVAFLKTKQPTGGGEGD